MERKGFIGGSDLYAIMNGKWAELWDIKMGVSEPDDLSDQFNVQLGIATEDFNKHWLMKQTGLDVFSYQEEFSAEISKVPYKGHVDGMTNQGHVVECKHTHGYNTMANMLQNYMPQMHLYMRLSGCDKAILSVIFGNQFEYVEVQYDEDYWRQVHQHVVNFWSFVLKGDRPPSYGEKKIDWSSIKIDGLSVRDASQDNMFVDMAHEFVNSSHGYARHEQAKRELKAMVQDTEREVFCDVLSIKRDKRGALRITMKEGAV